MTGPPPTRMPVSMAAWPTLTIVIVAGSRTEALHKAVRSVARQTDGHWNLLVVADDPADGAAKVVESWRDDRRMRLLAGAPDLGTAAAKSRAVLAADSEWIAFLDEGDELLPGFVAAWRGFVRLVPGVQFTWAGVERTGARRDTRRLRIRGDRWDGVRPHAHDFLADFDNCRAIAARREALLGAGAFREHFASAHALDMGMRLVAAGAAYAAVPQALVRCGHGAQQDPGRRGGIDSYELLRLMHGNCALLDQQPRLSRHFRRLAMIACYRDGCPRMARTIAMQLLRRGEMSLPAMSSILRFEAAAAVRRLRRQPPESSGA